MKSLSRITQTAGRFLLVSLFFPSLSSLAQDKAAEKDWKVNTQNAQNALKRNQLNEAAKFCAAAVVDTEQFSGDDPRIPETLRRHAEVCVQLREYPVALTAMRKALALDEKRYGTNDARLADDCFDLAQVSTYCRDFDGAEDYYARTQKLVERKVGRFDRLVGICLQGRGEAALMDHRLFDAERYFKDALELVESPRVKTDFQLSRVARQMVQAPSPGQVASVLTDLGVVYREMKRYADSESAFKRSLKAIETSDGRNSLRLCNPLFDYAQTLVAEQKYADAEIQIRRCLAILNSANSDHPMVAGAQKLLDQVIALQHKPAASP